MIKDILRRKEIDMKGHSIAALIIEGFPPELDELVLDDKKKAKKNLRKFDNALRTEQIEVSKTTREMQLGTYGKARLCKSIQNKLIESNYSQKTSVVIIEELARSVGIS